MTIRRRIALLMLAGVALPAVQPVFAEEAASALVRTAPVEVRMLRVKITGYGTATPQPGQTINLNLAKGGRVARLLAIPGQPIKKGQPIMEVIGDPVASLAFQQAENAVTFARRELERQRTLFAQQLATHGQVDAAERALRDAEESLAAQRALGGDATGDVLSAPFDGVLAAVPIAQGDRFQAGITLAQIAATGALRVQLGIEPEDSRRIRQGMKAHITSVFNVGQSAEGIVDKVAMQINPQTQLVDISLNMPGDAFLLGMKVKGVIFAGGHAAPAVPRQAVLRDENGAYVFQVIAGKAKRITVQAGEEDDGMVAVSGALLPKSPVVVLGNYELQDGMAVREDNP